MAKTEDLVFLTIPKDEEILLEGVMATMSIYSSNKNRAQFKYAFTTKGLWSKSHNFLFIKGKEVFIAYEDIREFKEVKYGKHTGYIFFPKSGKKPGNRVFFDKNELAEKIIKERIREIK